ncbi:chaperone NapD [Halomonas daqiaonensis]|uniref:Chaperone NapD n=1 Tax=Halomonas daqiaonensis TaxID=650850 RepID=A0A1H7RG07_9GAMM|nr:chaperone NapD [Halomonas daqiaonensis]SEL58287.1 periplasmic nitrate reductase chaperone NapD [Halomonas daqiaonensis]
MPSDVLHVTSFLVHVQPANLRDIADWLAAQTDCDVSAEDPSGKLVVVVESPLESRVLDLIDSVQSLSGVLGAALVYHELLDPDTADEPQQEAPS